MTSRYRIIPPDEVILADIAAGLRNFEIAEKLKCSPDAIGVHVRKYKLRADAATQASTKEKLARPPKNRRKMPLPEGLQADIDAGLTNKEIAAKYGVAMNTRTTFITANGLGRGLQRATTPSDDVIVECLCAGMSPAEIAKKYGCTADPIHRRIRRANLRDRVDVKTPMRAMERGLRPTATKFINNRGISVPRIVSIHGPFEVRP